MGGVQLGEASLYRTPDVVRIWRSSGAWCFQGPAGGYLHGEPCLDDEWLSCSLGKLTMAPSEGGQVIELVKRSLGLSRVPGTSWTVLHARGFGCASAACLLNVCFKGSCPQRWRPWHCSHAHPATSSRDVMQMRGT